MKKEQFLDILYELEIAKRRNFTTEFKDHLFMEIGGRSPFDLQSAVKTLSNDPDPKLPNRGQILGAFPKDEKTEQDRRQETEKSYYADVSARATEAERVVGDTFENFLKLNNGDHTLAALYFGRAYFNARGISRYDYEYDRRIRNRERFLQNPKAEREKRTAERKKEVAERMDVGRAMDAAAGYAEEHAPAVEEPAAIMAPSPKAPSPPESIETIAEENLPF